MDELETLILTDNLHCTALRKDGTIFNIRHCDDAVRDTTDYVSELANADGKGAGMKIKQFMRIA